MKAVAERDQLYGFATELKQAGLYRQYTMHELLLKVRKMHIVWLNGQRIMQPVTKEQNQIFKQLDFHEPVG